KKGSAETFARTSSRAHRSPPPDSELRVERPTQPDALSSRGIIFDKCLPALRYSSLPGMNEHGPEKENKPVLD
ncbi:zinc finger transcription factor 1, partial [Moniliophthora roreri]